MNPLLDILNAKGPATVGRLKRLYRRLTKRTHPDLTRESHERFLQLRQSFEQALRVLESPAGSVAEPLSAGQVRPEVLRSLYRYALKFNGIETSAVFARLLDLLKPYRPEIYREMLSYRTLFLDGYEEWRNDARVYYAHSLWIASIRELAYYHSTGEARYLTLLKAYRTDLLRQTDRLEALRRENLRRLVDWLLQEAAGDREQIVVEVIPKR